MIEIRNLTIKYNEILFKNQNIIIKDNHITLLIGDSGSGKTSLLYYIGLISKKHEGQLILNNINVNGLNEKERTAIRRNDIGFVFQEYMLLDHFTIYENLKYYSTIEGKSLSEDDAIDLLRKVRLDLELDRKLYTLSGGQKQRLAIACAICKNPSILILDEPTSALDEENTKIIFEILNDLKKDRIIIVSSHNKSIQKYVDEIIEIKDKNIVKIKESKHEGMIISIKKSIQTLSYSFYNNYIKKFKNKIKMQISLLRLVIIFTLLFNIFTLNITNLLIDNTKGSINNDNLGQIFIRSDKELEESLFNDKHIVSKYKYYDTNINMNYQQYPVIPYYNENNLSQKIWTKFNQQKGMYLSYELYEDVSFVIVPNSNFEYILDIGNKQSKINLEYCGILTKGLEGIYVNNCTRFVYVPHDIIESLSSDMQLSGYTVFINDYNSIIEFCDKMSSLGYEVNNSFNQFETLQNYIMTLNYTKYVISIIIVIISAVLLNFVYNSYFNERKKEFALLKSNGLLNSELVKLVMIEFIEEFIRIVISSLVFIGILSVVIDINLIENIILIFVNSITILLLLLLSLSIKIKNINPEKVFRDF